MSSSPDFSLHKPPRLDIWQPLRQWIDHIEVRDRQFATFICHLIPCQCPFERTITLFGRTLIKIPPLCKLNPLYNELIALRVRALAFLSDICHEDITQYIC
ncbi:MAG TPA: Mo-dependent nitrogenase C-terminal domain-containing protein [Synechococcales cyanobacterium M55_K2018_004]|nr:Mo-dependent nitrogenase C-terminal domain-containing protein [Synechococcales cyanobacterium M55_K2018_004]